MTPKYGIDGMINRVPETSSRDETVARRIIGVAMKVHRVLGCGFVEAVYANALVIELQKAEILTKEKRNFRSFTTVSSQARTSQLDPTPLIPLFISQFR